MIGRARDPESGRPGTTHPLHGEPRERVGFPMLPQRWLHLVALHWRYDVEVLRRRVPAGLTVETFDDSAWLSLVGFTIDTLRVDGLPSLPWITFTQVNVRTYVHDRAGRDGIWFFSLDIPRLPVVLLGRLLRLPTWWSRTTVRRSDRLVRCTNRRGRVPNLDLVVAVGEPVAAPTALDHFLTARWRAFIASPVGLLYTRVWHPRLSLRTGTTLRLEEHLVGRAGLPAPTGGPLVHYGEPVPARLGPPRRAGNTVRAAETTPSAAGGPGAERPAG